MEIFPKYFRVREVSPGSFAQLDTGNGIERFVVGKRYSKSGYTHEQMKRFERMRTHDGPKSLTAFEFFDDEKPKNTKKKGDDQ